MFKFLLAFIVWLFATGEYSKWIALVQTTSPSTSGTSAAGTSTSSTSPGASTNASSSGNLQGALAALGSLTHGITANNSASGTSTPADLIAGYTG